MRTYRQLIARCKELDLSPCKGTYDVLNAKVAAEEERRAKIATAKAESRTIDLPNELIRHEVVKYLDFPSLLSYCQTNQAAKAFCEKESLLEERIKNADYMELKESFVYWAWTGTRVGLLVTLLFDNLSRLDRHIVRLVYYHLLEQGLEAEAKEIKQRYLAAYPNDKYLQHVSESLFVTKKLYVWLNKLVAIVKTNTPSKKNANDSFKLLKKIVGTAPLDYLSSLLVDVLDDEEIVTMLELIHSYAVVHKYAVGALRRFMNWLTHILHQNGRLNDSMIEILERRSLNVYVDDIIGNTEPGKYYKIETVFLIDPIIEIILNGDIPLYAPYLLSPDDFISIAATADDESKDNLIRSFVWFYIDPTSEHSVWNELVLKKMKERGFDFDGKF